MPEDKELLKDPCAQCPNCQNGNQCTNPFKDCINCPGRFDESFWEINVNKE